MKSSSPKLDKIADHISTPSPAITRFPSPIIHSKVRVPKEEKINAIAKHFKSILEILGMDLTDQSICRTPERIAKMYVEELFAGLDESAFPSISFFDDEFHEEIRHEIVFVKVGFTSMCEHHLVPMAGYAYVAYIPNKKFIGLSKIPRIVRYFAKRPQLQERLSCQIADSLSMLLETENVAVSISARHQCVIARGIQDEHSHTITNTLRGEFQHKVDLRKEFFDAINRKDLT